MIQPMLSTTEDVPRGRAMDVALLAAVCVVGAVIRILPAAHAAFPLGDGGLFTSLIEDLLRSGPTLPVTATYNGEAIPYVYPPLAFYLVAALVKGTGVPVLAWMQWLPVAASIAFIPAVYALVRRATRDRSAAVVAAAFIALGNGYQNLVQGGGLTKSLGLVFAVLAIERFLAVLDRQSASRIAAAGALAAAATLSHPAAGPLCAITFAWITLLRWRGGRTLRAALTVALLASLIVLPWAAAAVGHHGLGPLVAAASVDRTLLGALRGVASAFYVHPLPLWTALMLAGIYWELRRRRWFAPGWLLLIGLLDQRDAFITSLPAAAWLAAVGWEVMVSRPLAVVAARRPDLGWLAPVTVGALGLVLAAPLLLWPSDIGGVAPRRALTDGDLAATEWVHDHVPSGTRFAVVTGQYSWADDLDEWFPTLTGSVSVGTFQGTEWLGTDAWERSTRDHELLQTCAHADVGCLDRWVRATGLVAAYVYVPGPASSVNMPGIAGIAAGWGIGTTRAVDCCGELRAALDAAGAQRVYAGDGARIYALPRQDR